MKGAILLIVAASLFLLASAGIPQDLAALQAQVNIQIVKDNVREATTEYTLLFDHFIAVCGISNNVSNPACPAALDDVMDVFCDDASFQGWSNWFQGFPIIQNTRADVRSFYATLPTRMGGLSDHRIYPGIVTVTADLRSATFVGKLSHTALNAAGQSSIGYGIYTNEYKVNATDLSVCMSSFYLMSSYTTGPSADPVTKNTSRI